MEKRELLFVFLLCIITCFASAGGRGDNQSREAANPAGFTEFIDIENLAPGTWNIYLEARDRGGNVTIEGPHNIFIDPASDLPRAQIINPQPNMHIRGNLNIVGTSADDDGVAFTMLRINRGHGAVGELLREIRAEGRDFWSYYLDTSDTEVWRDGAYTLTAWAVDINGLSGISGDFPEKVRRQHQISWHLDRERPEIRLTSHELGAITSGKVNLRGTVWDGNGVEALYYSLDNGLSFRPLRLRYDRRDDIYNFNIAIDTRKFEDGPELILLKARDSMGTEGLLSFLIFVNNSGPEVGIVYPAPGETVNGIFTVAGYATHKVGLASLSWTAGKESGEIDLIAGNQWWAKEIDIRGQNLRNLDIVITATDLTGNRTVVRQRFPVDQEAGRPKITLNEPYAGMLVPGDGMRVAGVATDNNGVVSVFYSLNGGPAVEIPASGYFQFVVADIPAGLHDLEVWAKDITGVLGPKTLVRGIVAPGIAPEITIDALLSVSGKNIRDEVDFYSGMEVSRQGGEMLRLLLHSGSALESISYQFGSMQPETIPVRRGRGSSGGGDFVQNIPIPPDIEGGFVRLEVTAKDIHGRGEPFVDYIFLPGINTDAPAQLIWLRPESVEDGRILLSKGESLLGLHTGRPLRSVEIFEEDESDENDADEREPLPFSVSLDSHGRVNLSGLAAGNYSFRLNLTDRDGRVFTTPEYNFLVASGNPELEIVENPNGKWLRDQVPVQFRFAGSIDIRSVDFSIDLGNNWQPLLHADEIAALDINELVQRYIDISAIADGTINVDIRVTDEARRQTVKSFMVRKDTQAPQARLIVPVSGARLNGRIRLGIEIREAGRLASVFYGNPGTGENPGDLLEGDNLRDNPLRFLYLELDDTMPLSSDMSFTFTDAAGNSSVLSDWQFIIDEKMDLPEVYISLPIEGEVFSSDFVVSGVTFDDDRVSRIFWRFNDGEEHTMEAAHGFSIPVSLALFDDNENYFTIYAEDIYGVKGLPVTRSFKVSLNEPMASVTSPALEEILGGVVRIGGIASDGNEIALVQFSLDNGNTFNNADGAEEWEYTFNSKILPDGPNVVFIRVWDKFGISAIYASMIVIDNTPPLLAIETPLDGLETTGLVSITGQALDNKVLESIVIKISSLEGVEIPAHMMKMQAKLDSIILEELDLRSLPNGSYNVEVLVSDRANNVSRVSRNILLAKDMRENFVELLYPLDGEFLHGNFNLYGYTGGAGKAHAVTLTVNDNIIKSEFVNEAGYYLFTLGAEELNPGSNTIAVYAHFGANSGDIVKSGARVIEYNPYGPWVTVDTINMGDFVYDRPWLTGRAGYALSESDMAILEDGKAAREIRSAIRDMALELVELSFDNGRSFFPVEISRGQYDWRYRLETQDMPEGLHFVIVRASMRNGETALTRLMFQVDRTPPTIRLVTPQPGGHYNTNLEFTALASDDTELSSLSFHLRRGNWASYEVPGFIKGLYIESTIPPFLRVLSNDLPAIFAGGATFFDIGMGLSFFDDNVKLQFSYGQMTQDHFEMLGGGQMTLRYGGHVLGLKILANVYTLPFSGILGADWEWLSASFAVGANFSLFDAGREGLTQSGNPTWISAMVAQMEFPKVSLSGRTVLRTFSLFTEGQLWFVPTDVDAAQFNIKTVIPSVIMGLRIYIF